MTDFYRLLGVADDASPQEIRRAWRTISKRVHPDAGGTAEEFRATFEAYHTLSDPYRRASYDASRRRGFETVSFTSTAEWSGDALVVDVVEGWDWTPGRTLRTTVAIAMALMVLVSVLLVPAVLASSW